MLTPSERAHYARQIRLSGFGDTAQARLRDASVLMVGVGGLGSPAALYLAAAGVGHLILVDDDVVDVSNLHRQVLYTSGNVGRPKHQVAAERLRAMNPHIEITSHGLRFDAESGPGLLDGADLVLDGADTFATRYLVNDLSVRTGVANVFASVDQWTGQASVFHLDNGPCYRCLFPEPPPEGLVPSCADGGVLGVLPGLLGLIQATEAIKVLTGLGDPLSGRVLTVDAATMRMRELRVDRDPACPVCGSTTPPKSSPLPMSPSVPEITPTELAALRADGEAPLVLDVRQPDEYEAANIGGTLIPLGDLPDRLDEIASHKDDEQIVVHCRSGGRSAQAVQLLHSAGFTNAVNLAGGIHAWSDTVDPSVAKV